MYWKKLFRVTGMVRNYWMKMTRGGEQPEISLTQLQIISCVLLSPGNRVRVRDISDDLGITPGGVSQQVEHLVRLGILERNTDETDRRAVSITLSAKGRELNCALDEFFAGLFGKLFAGVPEEEQRIFVETLDRMIASMEREKAKLNHKKIEVER